MAATSSPISRTDSDARHVSEAMIRLRRMLKTGVVSAGDRVEYSIKTTGATLEFFAELAADGSIVKPHEVVEKTPKSLPDAEFDSPTAFANAMYTHNQERLQNNRRRPCINGWTDCTVNGKTLTDLRYIMYLRERKHSSTSSPTASALVDTDVPMRDAQSPTAKRTDDSSKAPTKENTMKPTSPIKLSIEKPAVSKMQTPEKASATVLSSSGKRISGKDESKEFQEPVMNTGLSPLKALDSKDLAKSSKPSAKGAPEAIKNTTAGKRQRTDNSDSKRNENKFSTETSEKEIVLKPEDTGNAKGPARGELDKRAGNESTKSNKEGPLQAPQIQSVNQAGDVPKLFASQSIENPLKKEASSAVVQSETGTQPGDSIKNSKLDNRDRKAIQVIPPIRSEPPGKKGTLDRTEGNVPLKESVRPQHGENFNRKTSDSGLHSSNAVADQGAIGRVENDSKSRNPYSIESSIRKDQSEKINQEQKEAMERSECDVKKASPKLKEADEANTHKKESERADQKCEADPEILPDAPPPVKRTASPEPAVSDKGSDDTSDDNAKKKKNKTQKRKRSATPQSDEADGERSTRAKSRRRVLDPASAEAAAVAAAAEKQEAFAAKRTTRLASGKISKVVYTAPSRPVTGDNESDVDIPSRQLRRKDKTVKRGPKRRIKSGIEGSESGSDEEESEDEVEERKRMMTLITHLALAIQRAKSASVVAIIGSIGDKSVSSADARDMVEKVLVEIRSANVATGFEPGDDSIVQQLLAYLVAEFGRWNSGQMRPMAVIGRRKMRLEKKLVSAEKFKRRAKREYDEAIAKLEAEMESRRKVELEAAHMTMQLDAMQRSLDQENDAKAALTKEVRFVKLQDAYGRKRVESTKRLMAQLVEAAKDNDAPQHAPMEVDVPNQNGPTSSTKKQEHESGSMCESMTSDDEREAALPRAPQTGSTPMDPARAAEVERLRSLVRTRGAESEEWQRLCEMEYIRLRALLDQKDKLDTQIYRKKSKMPNLTKFLALHATAALSRQEASVAAVAITGSGGANSSAVHAAKHKDLSKKERTGSSKHANVNGKTKGSSKNAASGMSKSSKKSSKKDDKSKRKSSKPTATSA